MMIFKKLSLLGLLVTAVIGTTAYGMDESDKKPIRSLPKIPTTQAPAQPLEDWNPTEEELLRIVAQYEEEEAKEAAHAKAKQEEEDRARAKQAEQDLKALGTNVGQALLADANVQNFLNVFGGPQFASHLQAKNDKSLRHRREEEENFQKYGYRLANRKMERLFKNGTVQRK